MTMPYEADEELLEYETGQDDQEPVAPAAPIPVCVKEPVVTVPTVPQHLTTRTVVLTDGTPAQILALDPLRVRAQLIVKGPNDVVLCHSIAQAQDPANLDNTLAHPNGMIIPAGQPVEITACGPAWLVANTFPTRVGVAIERRS